ncbi:hypothetical protein V9T40_011349 [Parthenolecanium corni]|uniref:Uncharacterized protein n=1 Tax=Parthenolecanium corni TaxID=536013 RepID=A0AAN9T980_9HEMI
MRSEELCDTLGKQKSPATVIVVMKIPSTQLARRLRDDVTSPHHHKPYHQNRHTSHICDTSRSPLRSAYRFSG